MTSNSSTAAYPLRLVLLMAIAAGVLGVLGRLLFSPAADQFPVAVALPTQVPLAGLSQISTQYGQQATQLETFQQRVTAANAEQLKAFLTSQGIALEGPAAEDPQALLLKRINQLKQQLQTQTEAEKVTQRNRLIKRSAKWNLSILLAGLLFAYSWHLTSWARAAQPHRGLKKI